MSKFVLLLSFLLLPLLGFGQFKTQAKPMDFTDRLQSGANIGILGIDPSRFSMAHSYSMSYMSAGGQGFTQGLYLNTMSYQFSLPLTVSLQLGMAHNPFQGDNTANILQNGFFVSGAQVKYKPTEKTTIQLEFHQMPYQHYPGYHYFAPRSSANWFE
ncbi:hypothetical protein JXA02_07155 [candidate division KSB1 bacterium]|nr:hypothetical protein [candidate division KSB1 bacterium]RQW06635.1 MAG: hypothetical protein EH222_08325 [candidate division KSB1 bacterium]